MLDENLDKGVKLSSSILHRIIGRLEISGRPIPSIKSALPHLEEIERLPCLITGTPALATINDTKVDILKLCDLSPPVPHRSIALGAKSSSSGSTDNFRNSRIKTANSSSVSPFGPVP